MSRLSALLTLAALALVALGVFDIVRGDGPPKAVAAAPAAAPATAALDLTAGKTSLGTVVTSHGETLYRFDKDTAKPAKSNCAGQCATTWPPLLAGGAAPTLDGVDPALVGIVLRADGAEQVTLGGWPLYHYAADKPGEAKGEGVGGTWRVVGPSGKPAVGARAATPGSAPGAAPGSGSGPAKEPAPVPAPAPAPAPVPAPVPDTGGYGGY